jgi:putative redox protein
MFRGGFGHTLAAILDLPAGAPRGAAVFAPCFTCGKDLRAIVRISRALADRGIATLRFDPTGLGQSGGEFAETTFDSLLADVRAAAMEAHHQFGRCDALLGYSLGGAASLAVAEEFGFVRGVATIGAPSDTQHLAALLRRRDPAIEADGSGLVEIGGRRWTIRRELVDNLQSFDLAARLAELRKDVLLFHAPEDETVGYDHAIRLMQLIGGRAIEVREGMAATSLIALPGADHLLASHPQDWIFIADVLSAWLTRAQKHDLASPG